MKKYILLLLIILTMGCEKEKINIEKKEDENQTEVVIEKEPEYIDTNPIKVGLYNYGKIVENYDFKFKDHTDIAAFEVVFTNLPELGSRNLKENWWKYYNMYENIKDYKIGFFVEMEANGEKLENLVLDPSTMYKLNPYLHTYLYDGVHAKGHYTHLEMKDIKDDTFYSTIKLFLLEKSNEIASPIKLTVFTYKDENDFIDGHYRGNSKYTITITNTSQN